MLQLPPPVLRMGLCALALALPSPALAQAPLPGEDVSASLEELRADAGIPGLVAMALQDGEIVAWGAAGVRAEGSDERVTIADPFHLGSCAKAMTSTLIALLIDEEVLSWDTRIFDALPELEEGADPGYREVTVEHLMQHRGGIAERQRPEVMAIFQNFEGLEGSPREQRVQVARLALAHPPHTGPGEAFDYSNYGYMTAAAMVERLTDRSWEELIVEKLFEPMGMRSAGVGSPVGAHVPVGHEREEGSWTALPPGPEGRLPDVMGPAGLVHANLQDWGEFVTAHLAGERGEEGLLTSETYRRLHRDPKSLGYACGWGTGKLTWSWGEGATLAHNGSDGTWYTVVLAMPEWDLCVLAASNCGEAQGTAERARDHLLTVLGFKD